MTSRPQPVGAVAPAEHDTRFRLLEAAHLCAVVRDFSCFGVGERALWHAGQANCSLPLSTRRSLARLQASTSVVSVIHVCPNASRRFRDKRAKQRSVRVKVHGHDHHAQKRRRVKTRARSASFGGGVATHIVMPTSLHTASSSSTATHSAAGVAATRATSTGTTPTAPATTSATSTGSGGGDDVATPTHAVVTLQTGVTFVYCRYRIALAVDLSSSAFSVDATSGRVMFDLYMAALESLFRRLTAPLVIQTNAGLVSFTPQVRTMHVCCVTSLLFSFSPPPSPSSSFSPFLCGHTRSPAFCRSLCCLCSRGWRACLSRVLGG